jgi:chromosome segregation ATPase
MSDLERRKDFRARIAELENANAEHDTLRLEGLARIAELEAERDRLQALTYDDPGAAITRLTKERDKWHDDAVTQMKRIVKLEAERNKLKSALEIIRAGETLDPRRAADAALSPTPSGDISLGEALAYRSEDHGRGKKP